MIIAIIPARLSSKRLPRKMLAMINGKPLVYWTWYRASRSSLLDQGIVATDSVEIKLALEPLGVPVLMTSRRCRSGTERVIEAMHLMPRAQYVVNIQGDEPLIPITAINAGVR